jgi:single-strand DNA-binding protein
MLNHITIMGRLTADPELRHTTSGTPVASFTVAVERDFGEKAVDYISCVAWKHNGEFVSKYFRKGNMIALTGSLQSRSWEDKNGNKRTSWEVNVDHSYFAGGKSEAKPEEKPEAINVQFNELSDDEELPF